MADVAPISNQLRGLGTDTHYLVAEALDQLQAALNDLQAASAALAGAATIQKPVGVIDGVNTVFKFSGSVSTVALFRNGAYQEVGGTASSDCTLSGGTVTFNAFSIPQPGEKLWGIVWP